MTQHIERSAELLVAALEEFGEGAFATSSFQTQGMPLLHLVSLHAPRMPVFFIDTGFHFVETHRYLSEVWARLQLRVVMLQRGPEAQSEAYQAREGGDTDRCCHLMKVEPLAGLLDAQHRIRPSCWVSGVRHGQTRARDSLEEREKTPQGVTRIHPLLDWTDEQVEEYISDHSLPRHPLHSAGYSSIGCRPCTVPGRGRSGRWPGQEKEGCGIHNLVSRDTCED